MTDERFRELCKPFEHPLIPFMITRLTIALRMVVEATGDAGERALEAHSRARQQQDEDRSREW